MFSKQRKHEPAIQFLIFFGLALSPAAAATFSLGATIRAGVRGGQDWEIGLGAATPYASAVAHANRYFDDNEEYDFTIAYSGANNRATASVFTNPGKGPANIVTWNPAGGTPSTAGRLWTFSSLFVSAAFTVRPVGRPVMPNTEIRVENLQLGPGIDIVARLSATDLRARQQGASAVDSVAQPVVFRTRNGSGDWLLSGTIRMRGLASQFPSGAVRSELQCVFNSTSTELPVVAEVPEPGTWAMLPGGGSLVAWSRRRKRKT